MTILKIAEQIAREAHKGQKRWDGKPYITHPEAVAKKFKDRIGVQVVAWLHDVLEDSDLTFKDLLDKGIPRYLAKTVDLLTRKRDQNYKEYLLGIKECEIATKVKIADIMHNLINLNNGNMRDKYILSLYVLKN